MTRYSDTILSENPAAYWRLDDGPGSTLAVDLLGDNNLIAGGAQTAFVSEPVIPFGGSGSAFFNGSLNSSLYKATPSGLSPKLEQTFECWFSVYVLGVGNQYLVRYSPDASSIYVINLSNLGKIEVAWRVGGSWSRKLTGIVIQVNKPNHLVVAISSGGSLSVYLNGSPLTLYNKSTSPALSTDNRIRIGSSLFGSEPLRGYMDEVVIYNYELSASQIIYHYNLGINAFVEFDPPTVTYPNGGENIYDRNLDITWHNTEQTITSGDLAWHEIFFTENYLHNKKNNWLQIAQVPSSKSSFTWNVPKNIKGSNCRIGMRSRNKEGYRSRMSVSAANFTFGIKKLAEPAITSPVSGDVYKMFVPIVFNDEGIRGRTSQRARYEIMYSSENNDIDWSPVEYDVETTTNPIYWDIRDIQPGNDYVLSIRSVDQDGNSSRTIFIRNLKLTPSPVSQFIIDTIPPKGSISISDNVGYTKNRNLVLNMTAFDESTGVKSVQIRERMFNSSGELETKKIGPEQDLSNVKTWFMTNEDGIKFIEAIFRDYGDNRIADNDSGNSFRDWLQDSNNKVSALMINSFSDGTFNVWSAFFDGASSSVYKDQDIQQTLSGEAVSIENFVGDIYFGIKGNDGKGSLLKFGDSSFSHSFAENDSSISSLKTYGSKLYIGVDNGSVYVYNGTTVTSVSVPFSGRVSSMFSDGKFLYMFVDHDADIYIYDGTSFTTASVVDASKQI